MCISGKCGNLKFEYNNGWKSWTDQYPMTLATLSVKAVTTISNELILRLVSAVMPKISQIKGVAYSAPQNHKESLGCTGRSAGLVSKIHKFSPLSLTSDHQRRPTKRRPEIFLTVQKSTASRKMQATNVRMKELMKMEENKYVAIANPLKKT